MNLTHYKLVRQNGKRVPGIYQNRNIPEKIIIDAGHRGVRKPKTVTINANNQAARIKKAVELRKELITDIKEGYFLNRQNVDEVFEFEISFKKQNRGTKMDRAVFTNHIATHIGSKSIVEVTARDIDAIFLQIRHLKPRTRKGVSDLLKMIFRSGIDQKLIRETPMEKRHNVKLSYLAQKKIILGAEKQYRTVYKTIKRLYADYPVMLGIFLFGLLHGRRKTEVLKLRWDDVDFEESTYLIRAENSKINADLSFTLPDEIAEVLKKIGPQKFGFIFINQTTGKPFTNLQRQIVRVRNKSGFKLFSFHTMRNLLVSALAARGVSITHLSSILGHVDAATIRRYLSMQRQEASKVVEATAKELLREAPT